MFVGWISSDGSRSGYGCCGLPLIILPLLFLFSGFGDSSSLLWMVLGALFVLFVLPRLFNVGTATPAYGEPDDYKHKNEEYLDKPKRNEDYIVRADGEMLDVIDDDAASYTQSPGDNEE